MGITLQEINGLEKAAFIRVLGGIFEKSPWVAEKVYRQAPFRTRQELYAQMLEVVVTAGDERILELICAHPDLATRLKTDSYSAVEQRGAGLDSLSPEEYERFSKLNEAYKRKFGFPFILAVTGRTKEEIAAAMEERLQHQPEAERQTALREIGRIAEIRLNQLIAG
ncbi:OHCU decarboxylase [Paenibacillus yonginensis]|uniref:2-oxo-4-hydroxy-4-carboxy-5-ureidoimidazoline decarboxylase n=1 Tax=Paenibacillus yonginensis TaxID=1462996 RepID=A0A1B1MVX5_9BACL|nr:2-oxo-4-hydroxy-4-carboxy-5-ureidoimidazoline decarboxylase [Paenibacillus yonginensis]ANS73319.1 OHCU decarboxylase [Paenibacillus yonginensis]